MGTSQVLILKTSRLPSLSRSKCRQSRRYLEKAGKPYDREKVLAYYMNESLQRWKAEEVCGKPTMRNFKSSIDHIVTNNKLRVRNIEVTTTAASDHKIVEFLLKNESKQEKPQHVKKRIMKPKRRRS